MTTSTHHFIVHMVGKGAITWFESFGTTLAMVGGLAVRGHRELFPPYFYFFEANNISFIMMRWTFTHHHNHKETVCVIGHWTNEMFKTFLHGME